MKKTLCLTALVLALTISPALPQEKAGQTPPRMKPALLVIDIQNAYLPMVPDREKSNALELINASIALFRLYGFPVIRIYNTDPQGGPPPGSQEFEFPESVAVKPDDPKIIKNYASAFKKTDLDRVLHSQGSNTLFLCGLSAVGCVLATYLEALDSDDYRPFLVKDALMSHNSAYTKFVEEAFDALSYRAMKAMLENAQK